MNDKIILIVFIIGVFVAIWINCFLNNIEKEIKKNQNEDRLP